MAFILGSKLDRDAVVDRRDAGSDQAAAIAVELADRHSDDLDVALFWGRASGALWVLVTHRSSGRVARIDATAANALEIFNHPFAYAPEAA